MLAVYIDFLLFSALIEPSSWVVEQLTDTVADPLMQFGVFVLALIALRIAGRPSPGMWTIGVPNDPEGEVDERIRNAESWWTMFCGTLLVLEGSKNLVRWTQGLPPLPHFGADAPQAATFALISLLGVLNIAAGIAVLRAHWEGVCLAAVVLLVEMTTMQLHSEDVQAWMADAHVARRELQGIPMRPGELEFVQAASAWVPLLFALMLVLLVLVGLRLHRQRYAQTEPQ